MMALIKKKYISNGLILLFYLFIVEGKGRDEHLNS